MKHTLKITAAATLSLLAFTGLSQAQIEVISPEQAARYGQRLPALRNSATQTDFKTYLQSLQPTPATSREIANAVRVADDMKAASAPLAANAFFGHYVVPAMSPLMRVPDAYPADGQFGGEVRVTLAGDQYESASFQVYPFKNVGQVNLKVSPLVAADGSVLPAENVDLKVVKVWYQNGNAWLSYFADVGLKLVPELLLHDENLIRVDTQKQANYARIQDAKGTREEWISQPQKLEIGFDPYQDGFVDAKTLQPVAFNAGQFKQFVLNVHATPDTKAGIYRGNIAVTAQGQQPASIPVAVRVLPFVLPQPKANYDINKDFLVSLYSAWPTIDPDDKAFLPILKNMRAHNLLHLGPDVNFAKTKAQSTPEEIEKDVKAMKEAGFRTDHIFGGGLTWMSHGFDGLMEANRTSKKYAKFYDENFGHHNATIHQGDEQSSQWMVDQRPITRVLHQNGLKYFIAGNQSNYFTTSGFNVDSRPMAGSPGEADKANQWKEIGDGHTAFYANQHNGSENPAFVRRQHGLLGYLSNFDMVNNYEFAFGPWNDRAADLYKPMVLAYPISDGLVDTLSWEGFRAGIDDIRYATKLRQLANEAIDSGDLDRVEAGRKVRQWFALMDGNTVDLNTTLSEMIEKIENLTQLKTAK